MLRSKESILNEFERKFRKNPKMPFSFAIQEAIKTQNYLLVIKIFQKNLSNPQMLYRLEEMQPKIVEEILEAIVFPNGFPKSIETVQRFYPENQWDSSFNDMISILEKGYLRLHHRK